MKQIKKQNSEYVVNSAVIFFLYLLLFVYVNMFSSSRDTLSHLTVFRRKSVIFYWF